MYQIGIDIGGTRIKIGLIKNNCIISKVIIESADHDNFQENLNKITETINSIKPNKILSKIGIAFPGIIDIHNKKVLSTPQKFEDAKTIDFVKWAKENWNAEINIDNDARSALIGEKYFGKVGDSNNFSIITLGTGIGTSTMIDGKVLYGKHFQAGCLGGHFTVNYNGNLCKCGNVGCAEAEASTVMLEDFAKKQEGFFTSQLANVEKIDFLNIIQGVKNKDVLAEKVLEHFINIWSFTAINMIHAYDPEIIILFGGIMKSSEFIIPKMQKIIDKHAWTPWGKVKLIKSGLGDDAGILGITSDYYDES